jgi:hypothetical protein
VLEVLGQHFLRKLIGLVDNEAVAVVVPVYRVVVGGVLKVTGKDDDKRHLHSQSRKSLPGSWALV